MAHHKLRRLSVVLLGLSTALASAPAQAQATRTWVSGVGDDANPCSRTAPCKTFAGAISKTAAGGVINCLDPAGFGAVTITKAMTIDCEYVLGSALVSGTNAIIVNAAATDRIVLRGLQIEGLENGSSINGIYVIQAKSVVIDKSKINGFNSPTSAGVRLSIAGSTRVLISDSAITHNTDGLYVTPTGGSGTARIAISNARFYANDGAAVHVDTSGSTGPGVGITVDGGMLDGGTHGVQVNAQPSQSAAAVLLTGVTVSNNSTAGIQTSGANAVVRVNASTVIGNGIGISVNSNSTIATFGNNRVYGNSDNGAFNLTLTGQ